MTEQVSEQELSEQIRIEEEARENNNSLRLVLSSAGILIVGGTVFYHYVEGLSWLNSLYLCVISLATVGYGDFSPKTDAGKIFTMLLVFAGITVFVRTAQVVSQVLGDSRRKRIAKRVARRRARRERNNT